MPELESLRSIARRLVQQYREKRELQDVARLIEKLPEPIEERMPVPVLPPVISPFDLQLTEQDRAFLHTIRVRS